MEKAKKIWDWYEGWFKDYPRGAAIAFLSLLIMSVLT